MKKKLNGFVILLAGIMAVFALSGCMLPEIEEGTGWPSESILSKYKIGGFDIPGTIIDKDNASWMTVEGTLFGEEISGISIKFDAFQDDEEEDVKTWIKNYASVKGWAGNSSDNSGTYTKDDYEFGWSYTSSSSSKKFSVGCWKGGNEY